MTRFARAKGSKASNEKSPEDGTPWEVMKEQLLKAKQLTEDSKKREQAEQRRIENYENFLKEQKVQKRKATWCDFPEVEKRKNKGTDRKETPLAKKKKKNKHVSHKIDNEQIEPTFEKSDNKSINKTNNKNNYEQDVQTDSKKMSELDNPQSSSKKSQDMKKKIKQKSVINESDISHVDNNISVTSQNSSKTIDTQLNRTDEQENLPLSSKKKKKNKQNGINESSNLHNKNLTKSQNSVKAESNKINELENFSLAINKSHSLKKNNKGNNIISESDNFYGDNSLPNVKNTIKTTDTKPNNNTKRKKILDNEQHTRRKVINYSFQLILNGKEVELVRYEGFPIMKKDAERLEELKLSMMKKGIPKSEVLRTMKLERRRAEKALARMKREVCYNCRKGGHNLSDCPDLKSKIPGVDGGDGMCFKCGSTEHRQFECKVQRDKEFRFATCFICKEQGHIARQCPDNPKGMYPNGGCCKLCGDVTHLRKDCPTDKDKKEGTSLKLQTLDSGENIEDIGLKETSIPTESSRKPKKIKF